MDNVPASFDLDHLLSIAEAQRVLGVGRTTIYRLIGEGQLPAVKVGRRTLISESQVQHFIQSLSNQGRAHDDGGGA